MLLSKISQNFKKTLIERNNSVDIKRVVISWRNALNPELYNGFANFRKWLLMKLGIMQSD